MSLDIGDAIRQGFQRTIEKNGLMLAGVYFIVGLLNTSLSQSLASRFPGPLADTATTGPLALPLPPVVSGVLMGVLALASAALSITAIRTLVSDRTDSIPKEFYSRNMGWAILNTIVGGIAFAVVVGIGTVFLIIPGIFLLVSLYYWTIFVSVEDLNFFEAFQESWELTKGERIELFMLGLAVLIISGLVSGLLGSVSLIGLKTVGAVISTIGSSLTGVFTLATMAQAYNQLK